MVRELPCGTVMAAGHISEGNLRPWILEAKQAYAVDPWMGADLWAVQAFVAQGWQNHDVARGCCLEALGFRFGARFGKPDPWIPQVTEAVRGEGSLAKELGGLEEWEVLFPCQVVMPDWFDLAVSRHEAATHQCRVLSLEALNDGREGLETSLALHRWTVAQQEREWWETILEHTSPLGRDDPSDQEFGYGHSHRRIGAGGSRAVLTDSYSGARRGSWGVGVVDRTG